MSSYTADQYRDQRQVTRLINQANVTGMCVVCNVRPQACWPSGALRVTCGADACYRKWLRARPEKEINRDE